MGEMRQNTRVVHWRERLPFSIEMAPRLEKKPFDSERRRELMLGTIDDYRGEKWKLVKEKLQEINLCKKRREERDIAERVDELREGIRNGELLEPALDNDIGRCMRSVGIGKDEAVIFRRRVWGDFSAGYSIGPFAVFNRANASVWEWIHAIVLKHELWHVRQSYAGNADIYYKQFMAYLFTGGDYLNVTNEANARYPCLDFNREVSQEIRSLVEQAVAKQALDLAKLFNRLARKVGAREARELLLGCDDFDDGISACLKRLG